MPRGRYMGATGSMKRGIAARGGVGNMSTDELLKMQRKARGMATMGAAQDIKNRLQGTLSADLRRSGDMGRMTDEDVKRASGRKRRRMSSR